MSELTPPDRARCQADIPTGHSFLSFGGKPGRVRCEKTPQVIVAERAPGPDGQQGSMSLCLQCLQVMSTQGGGAAWKACYIKEIV